MNQAALKGLLISDFNIQNLAALLENNPSAPKVQCSAAPFGQVMQALMGLKEKSDFLFVWTRPEALFSSFKKLAEHQRIPASKILAEVDAFASLIADASKQAKWIFLSNWIFSSSRNDHSLLDFRSEEGVQDLLMRMNLRLAEKIKPAGNVFILNTQKFLDAAGSRALDPKLWYMAKVPYANEVFGEAAKEIKAALRGLMGQSRKLLVLDLDGILWREIVGETGWENLKLGGHDPIGEAYVDFQAALKSLTPRGILLGIASKNNAAYALEAIEKHPEMVLRKKDFAGWEINWEDKAQNIVNLAKKLNLGLDSVVFIDDNPAERARVREALPEIAVPDWPEDPMQFKKALLGLREFYAGALTAEDQKRAESYAEERQRTALKEKVKSYDEWLAALEVKITVEPYHAENRSRAVQLLNKTNQMNLTTRRMTESEFDAWAAEKNHHVWVLTVSDKFGNYGLTGLMSLEAGPKSGKLVDFLLSCRVLGKRVEETMIYYVTEFAHRLGMEEIQAELIKTDRNQPCQEFFEKIKVPVKDGRTILNAKKSFPKPEGVTMVTATRRETAAVSS